ncbi:MAG: hypothetical protein CME70_01790 [Halobacteriovorax sp.]|nr:hypothetical protein [Halobacteriovorax sp.]
MSNCPCESGSDYSKCCEPFHKGTDQPKTAEATMRSRYSAFVKGEIDYIYDSHNPDTRGEVNKDEIKTWSENSEWQGLDILDVQKGQESDEVGRVEFVAHYAVEEEELDHQEVADFIKKDGRWYFHDGVIVKQQIQREGPKVGRNDPCPCGSGKKHKKCCL